MVSGHATAFVYDFIRPVDVVEFYNAPLRHYFLSANPEEIAALDADVAGPGWSRTGFGFKARQQPSTTCVQPYCPAPVYRFFRPGQGNVTSSHFFTGNVQEANFLGQPGSGWVSEGIPFLMDAIPGDGMYCGPYEPVYRLYNGRGALGDGNHRYVGGRAERDRMLARGWIDEGIAFCSTGTLTVPWVKSFVFDVHPALDFIRSASCEPPVGSCITLDGMPTPTEIIETYAPTAFTERTGIHGGTIHALSRDLPIASNRTFFQVAQVYLGMFLDTRDRTADPYSGAAAIKHLPNAPRVDGADYRFFPFAGGFSSEVELGLGAAVVVKEVDLRGPNSHAYGVFTVAFRDRGSPGGFDFHVLSYGTVAPGEGSGRDMRTGRVSVGTALSRNSTYGRAGGDVMQPTPSGFREGVPRSIMFSMNVTEFRRALQDARRIEPSLSADPADYFVESFRFKNELVGEGSVGMRVYSLMLGVLPLR